MKIILTIFLIFYAELSLAINHDYQLPQPEVSAEFPYASKYITVLGSSIHYIDEGSGDPILYLHGNPTSSYLWRNIIPHLLDKGRNIAIDLVGMGKSDKPDIDYTFLDHYKYVAAFIKRLNLRNLTLVAHDWGATIAFEYAHQHPENVKAIAFMEAGLPPVFPARSDELQPNLAELYHLLRDPDAGYEFIVKQNGFVEIALPASVNRPLTPQEMSYYREPYLEESSRKAVYMWPQEIPLDGEPLHITQLAYELKDFMKRTKIPSLLLYGNPGLIIPPEVVPEFIQLLKNLETVYVGQGIHYLQEDNPEAIGRAIADWLRRLDDKDEYDSDDDDYDDSHSRSR